MSQLMFEPEELPRDRKAPERRCIVSRESLPKDKLIRFVIGPDGCLTPDLAGKLPGRGYWARCQKDVLEEAVSKKLFHKVAKEKVNVAVDLPAQVEALLQARALQAIALVNKAGQLLQGFDKIAESLKKQQPIALVHARDASEASLHKLPISAEKRFVCFPAEALSAKLGAENAVHLAILPGSAGESALKEIRRFTGFLQSEAL